MDAEVANFAGWLIIVALAVLVVVVGRWVGGHLSPLVVGILVWLRVIE